MDFFRFLTRDSFFYFAAFGLMVSGLGCDVFFCFSTWGPFFYVIAYGLKT